MREKTDERMGESEQRDAARAKADEARDAARARSDAASDRADQSIDKSRAKADASKQKRREKADEARKNLPSASVSTTTNDDGSKSLKAGAEAKTPPRE